jgi:kinesin family protein 20
MANVIIQLFEAEMRCAIIEAETREEVMREMEERMRIMERMYSKRLMDEVGEGVLEMIRSSLFFLR